MPDQGPAWLRLLRRRDVGWAAFFVLLLTLVGGVIAISARGGPRYHLNEVVDEPVVSRVAFDAEDVDGTAQARERARANVEAVYHHNVRYLESLRETLAGLLSLADRSYDEISQELRNDLLLSPEAHAVLSQYNAGDPAGDGPSPRLWQAQSERLLKELFVQPILSDEQYAQAREGRIQIRVVNPFAKAGEDHEQTTFFYALKRVSDEAAIRERVQTITTIMPPELRKTVEAVLLKDIQPTYTLDQELTQRRRQAAHDNEPVVMIHYQAGTQLVAPGTRLTGEAITLLGAERRAFLESRTLTQRLVSRAGILGTLLILALGIWLFIFESGSRVARNPMRGLAITALLLLCQALAVVFAGLWPTAPFGGVTFPTMLATVVLCVVYSRPFALVLGALHALVVTVTLDLPASFAIVLFTGVALAVLQLREIRSRSRLVVVGGLSGLGMAAVAVIVTLADHPAVTIEQWQRLGIDAAAAAASGFAAGLIVQGILPLIESVFRVTTAMTLKELNDNARPLLQRLSHEAPGTYQHSLRIADMAEAAADAIGADGLLCRVGAMYHDIGKINKPQYFIENQGGGFNKHNKLSPAMSLLIIVGHVKDGVEMAREYGLPRCIIHFIESHHGTTLVEYFYHAARKQQEQQDAPAPSEFEFRYPGPKPQTKEAAIMLICDGIEAAARACDEPTPARLQQITHSISMKRLMDGQFDECNLTLAELSKIEKAIVKTLCAIYHSRIKYPAGDSNTADKKEPPAEARSA